MRCIILVLTRKECERITIGKDIVLTVVEIRGGKVRLGFEAPRDIPIHRQEVWEESQQKGDKHVSKDQ